MKWRKFWWIAFVLTGVMINTACNPQHKYKIGISQCSSDDWRSKMNDEIMREVMLHDNVEVEIRSAEDSNEKQISDLDYFLRNNFDLIAVAPNEADALTPKIKEIYESGKPVIVYDRDVNGKYFTAYQGADNAEIGSMAAVMAGAIAKGAPQILEIKGLAGSSPAEYRHSGFKQTSDSLGYDILGAAYGNWNYEDAYRAVDSLLALYPATNVIYAHNDRMAIGANDAADSLGRTDIKIIGIDAAPRIGIKAVHEGKIDATFLYPTAGHQLMRTALAILEGKPYEKFIILPTPAPVDKTNAEILLLQDNVLKDETSKVSELQNRVISFSQRYTAQANILYVAAALVVMSAILIFVLLRLYWNGKRHHRQIQLRNEELARQRDELDRRNEELAAQRDELDQLYRQLQEATGSKLTFFTNVSHDLRTPLTLIADPVNQLAEADNLTPTQHTLMQLADKNVKRLQRLINQILDIRKYDSGQLKLHLVNVNLTNSIREWVAPFVALAARQHVKFNIDVPLHPEITIAIDVEKTERILFNLLSNAFKFTPQNGTIKVALGKDEANAIITVSDTGMGIPPEDLNNVFQRFFKTDKINPNGSGIGLALSKVFIDMHGGSIAVESEENIGTKFTVKFPLRQVEVSEDAHDCPAFIIDVSEIESVDDDYADIKEDTPTVLIIDDNRDICTLVKNVMCDRYTVLTANSGAQGIRLANKYVPDLIICDVMMPGMSGYEVCTALKKDTMTSHIPVLLLTACSRDEQRVEGYECGADAFMTKPFESGMLMARCKSLIENRTRIYKNLDTRPASADNVAPAKPSTNAPQSIDDEFLNKFTALVEREIANSELSVEWIADSLGLSRVQLYRKIKAVTNYSAAEMVRNIRLRRAAAMLKTTISTISEIAYAVGFSSPSYFSRCYKEYYNETPAETQNRTSKAR